MKHFIKKINQPPALYLLFFCELWERYGFYAVQTLLVLFLTNTLHYSDNHAYDVSGAYSALLYASPVIGGYFADRVLGFQRAIIFGFLLYIAGFMLIFFQDETSFYVALALLIAANGYFKANISSLLGTKYEKDDPRRDSGFTIFYMGINLGGFISPIISAYIQRYYGYHAAFASCSIGLLIGLAAFLSLRKKLIGESGLVPRGHIEVSLIQPKHQLTFVYLFTFLLIIYATITLPYPMINDVVVSLFGVAATLYAFYETFRLKTREARLKMIALIILILYSVIFWAYYMQMFFSILLYTERNINRVVLGHLLPTTSFVMWPFLLLVIASPFAAKFWTWLDKKKKNPSTPLKFALSMFFMGATFLALIIGNHFPNQAGLVSPWWLILSSVLRIFGELLLSPIGLSAVTKFSPHKLTGMMMGMWFLALGAAMAFAGTLADHAAIPKTITNKFSELLIYNHAFWFYTLGCVIFAVLFLFVTPLLKRMLGEQHML